MWRPHCIEACKKLNPDIIVCDIWSRNGIIAADELGIPSVINSPLPLSMLKDYGLIRAIDAKEANNCCGCLCI